MIDTPYVYPIWRTLNYAIDADADTLYYRIVTENTYYIPPVKETVHEGIASRRPEDEYIYINLNRPCAPHIDSKLIPSSATGDTAEGMNAYRAFQLQIKYNADDEWNPIHDFAFVNDWSYGEHLLSEEYDSGLFNFSEPINGKAAPGQILPQTWLAMSGGTDACYEIETGEKPYEEQYLTFEIISGGTIGWTTVGFGRTGETLFYSTDNGNSWTEIHATAPADSFTKDIGTEFNVRDGDIVLLKGNRGTATNWQSSFKNGTAIFNAYGNILSLAYGDDFTTADGIINCYSLFYLSRVRDASNLVLPETVTAGCYRDMFAASELTAAPVLPATELIYMCYYRMFRSCTGLTESPVLPAAYVPDAAYWDMFNGCTSLTKVTCLATEIYTPAPPATSSTHAWLTGAPPTGVFIKAASMDSWASGTSGIPTGWTIIDY